MGQPQIPGLERLGCQLFQGLAINSHSDACFVPPHALPAAQAVSRCSRGVLRADVLRAAFTTCLRPQGQLLGSGEHSRARCAPLVQHPEGWGWQQSQKGARFHPRPLPGAAAGGLCLPRLNQLGSQPM